MMIKSLMTLFLARAKVRDDFGVKIMKIEDIGIGYDTMHT